MIEARRASHFSTPTSTRDRGRATGACTLDQQDQESSSPGSTFRSSERATRIFPAALQHRSHSPWLSAGSTDRGPAGHRPGGGAGAAGRLHHGAPTGIVKTGIAERFAATAVVRRAGRARAFFNDFADDYDHLIAFIDFPQSIGPGAFAFELPVKNEIKGLGLETFDFSASAGAREAAQLPEMGFVARTPPIQGHLPRTNSTSTCWAGAGHRWLAYMHFIATTARPSDALWARPPHWASATTAWRRTWRATSCGTTAEPLHLDRRHLRYSPLDQYAMG